MVKGGDDCAPVERENILIWANNNGMTINLTKTKKLIVRGKSKGLYLLLSLTFTRKYI